MSTTCLFDHRIHHRPKEPDIEYLIREANLILDRAMVEHAAVSLCPMLSGGNDSVCSTHLCSERNEFCGHVWNIDTGTGIEETRLHAESVCRQYGWFLNVLKSEETIDKYVAEIGMPGPGRHQFVYNRLKERCVREIVRRCKGGSRPVALVTGCRSSESDRRMGHVEEIKRGSSISEDGVLRDPFQLWVAPIANWTRRDKALYMDEMGLPSNPVTTILGISGECLCGCFAHPGERETIREHFPAAEARICELEAIATAKGLPCVWGQKPPDEKPSGVPGPLCHGCDIRQMALFGEAK